jgi:dGTPase
MSGFRRRTREHIESEASRSLAPAATIATGSGDRFVPEEPDPYRTAFEVDRDRIMFSKAFRRLKHKTQVFMNPEGDHFVTRLTHTLKVSQIGRAIARRLGLNEALTEAGCLGHDVGHSPFGHTGEDALSEFVSGNWLHASQSARIFEVLEPLNLTVEVLDAIRTHSWKVAVGPATTEGAIVRFADRIAYLAHDAEDAVRAGLLTDSDFPPDGAVRFGRPGQPWITTMVDAVVEESLRTDHIGMDASSLLAMNEVRDFMFERVYLHPDMEPQRRRAQQIVRELVEYFLEHPSEIPLTYLHEDADTLTQVIDYVAGMTDRFAMSAHDRILRPQLFG